LVKKDDDFASEEEVIKKNKSVKSGKTLARIAKQNGVEVKHPEEDSPAEKSKTVATKIFSNKAPAKKSAKIKTAVSKSASRKKKALT
jgi:hypothetical protein